MDLILDSFNCCRICAKESKVMLSLFDVREKKISLAEMIADCTQLTITPNDNRPQNICRKCIQNLTTSHEFCQLAKESEEKFRQMLESQEQALKAESEESDSSVFAVKTENIQLKEEKCDDSDDNIPDGNEMATDEEDDPSKPLTVFVNPADIVENQSEVERKIKKVKSNKSSISRKKKKPAKRSSSSRGQIMRYGTNWECFKCKVKPSSLGNLRLHLQKHREATPNECTVCGYFFSTPNFNEHLCRGQSVQCQYCPNPELFDSTIKLLKHLENDHSNQIAVNKCDQFLCNKRLPMKTLYDWHLALHNRRFMSFVCSICGSGYSRLTSYKMHMQSHSETSYLCQECGQGFRYSFILVFRISLALLCLLFNF